MKNDEKKWFYVSVVILMAISMILTIILWPILWPEQHEDPEPEVVVGVAVERNDTDGSGVFTLPPATTADGESLKNDKDSPAGPWDGTGDGFRSAPPVITDPETDEPIDSPAWSGGH
jgi:hypothetical protein